MAVPRTTSFYASLADGEYRLADLPGLKDQWERGEQPTLILPRPSDGPAGRDVSVIVRGGLLAGIRVGDGDPITHFPRSRDAEYKWIDA